MRIVHIRTFLYSKDENLYMNLSFIVISDKGGGSLPKKKFTKEKKVWSQKKKVLFLYELRNRLNSNAREHASSTI